MNDRTDTDGRIEDQVRAASASPTDESRLYYAVLARLDQGEARRLDWLPRFGPGMATAGFAAMMIVGIFVGYGVTGPTLDASETDILRIAFGDAGALGSGDLAFEIVQ